ncbi:MAG TPA: MEDS domain-containing protein [Terriglobia bacterium]
MGAGLSALTSTTKSLIKPCQLVVRRQEGPSEFLRFVLEGLEVGQQVVALAGPGCLTNLARALSESGLQPQTLLRSGRLVFHTAPDCLGLLSRPDGPLNRSSVRRQAPIVRWVSDWSWAYSNGRPASLLLDYQRRVHQLIRSFEALSLCTVHSFSLERRALLAVLADHRQAVRGPLAAASQPMFPPAGLPQ